MPKRKKQKLASSSEEEKGHDGPLFRVESSPGQETQQPRLLDSHPNLLADMLGGSSSSLTSNEFLTNHFQKQAVYVPSTRGPERVEKIKKYMLDLNVKDLFENSPSENIFVWLQPQQETENGAPRKINSIEVPEPETAHALYQAGHATYCRAPPQVEELLLSALLENTGLGCGQYDASGQSATSLGRAEVETFISTKAGSITGFHTDFQENFTIQLSGRKRWTLQQGNVAHVLRGVTPHYAVSAVEGQIKAGRLGQKDFTFGPPTIGKNAVGPVDEVILEPGDVLYFPAGMWHKIDVLEPGVSINCSLMATNYATLICQSLQHVLLHRPEWRASVCRPADGTTVTKTIQNLLHGLPEIIKKWTDQHGAAQAMIPPVLQHGEVIFPDDENDENLMEDMAGVCNHRDEEGQHGNHETNEENGSASVCSTGTGDVGVEEEDPIVDLDNETPESAEFDPSQSAIQEKHRTHKLVRNPLALLLNENEVVRHYQTNGKGPSNDHIYILNVNYAGNEAHESYLRLRIRTSEANLDRMSPDTMVDEFIFKRPYVIAWFLYLGYLVWVPRN